MERILMPIVIRYKGTTAEKIKAEINTIIGILD